MIDRSMIKDKIKNIFAAETARVLRAVLTACLVFGVSAAGAVSAHAEGTRDLYETAKKNYFEINTSGTDAGFKNTSRIVFYTYRDPKSQSGGVYGGQKIKFYAFEGDVIFLGSSAYPTNYSEETDKADNSNSADSKDGSLNHYDVRITDPNGNVQWIYFDYDGMNSEGYIKNHTQEAAGPMSQDGKPIYLPKIDGDTRQAVTEADGRTVVYNDKPTSEGYKAYSFTANLNGVYIVEFRSDANGTASGASSQLTLSDEHSNFDQYNATNSIAAWDITVTTPVKDASGQITRYNAHAGRVWADALRLQMHQNTAYGYLYTVTRDGYIWRLGLNGICPYTCSIYANARGCIGVGTNASAYHSVHEPMSNKTEFDTYTTLKDKNGNVDGLRVLGPDNMVTDLDSPYHMFFNYPANDIPDSVVNHTIKEVGTIDSVRFDGRNGEPDDVSGSSSSKTNDYGMVGVGGYFEIDTTDATSYRILIDMENMYAKKYHGENGYHAGSGSGGDPWEVHEEEICLSTEDDINFIYWKYESDEKWDNGEWWGVFTKDKNDRHPLTNVTNGESLSNYDFSKIIECRALTPAELKLAGLDGKTPTRGEDLGDYKCCGKLMLGNAAVDDIVDRIYWNGRDQYGRILPVGKYFGDTGLGKVYVQAKAGEVHFPLSDAEQIANGLSIWLTNAPSSITSKSTNEQLTIRSSLYYNNVDKSLLRDFTVTDMYRLYKNSSNKDTTTKDGRGNNAWYWNLPSDKKCNNSYSNGTNDAGQYEGNAKLREFAWDNGKNGTYENKSIVGALSYGGIGESGLPTNPTKTACAFPVSNSGCDHGVVDVWTHVIADANDANGNKELTEPISLCHVADKVIVTGFVYLEDYKNTGTELGKYSTATDDTAIVGASVHAEYGTKEKITYETVTNTNGFYSIPIDVTAFKSDDKKQTVKITVSYNGYGVSEGIVGYDVTTVKEGSNKYGGKYDSNYTTDEYYTTHTAKGCAMTQTRGDMPNVAIIEMDLYIPPEKRVDATGNPLVKKEFYAAKVGYYSKPTDPSMEIQKVWTPADKKSSSLNASFTIYGYLKDSTSASIEPTIDTEGSGTPEEQQVTHAYVTGDALLPYSATNTAGYVIKREHVTVDEQAGGSTVIDDLPSQVFIDAKACEVVYKVVEEKISDGVKDPLVKHESSHTSGLDTHDWWEFTNEISFAKLTETVWKYNKAGAPDSGPVDAADKTKITDATVTIEKIKSGLETEKSFEYTFSDAEKAKLSEVDDGEGSTRPHEDKITITGDTVFSLTAPKQGDTVNINNVFCTEDGVLHLDNLLPGDYKITITFNTTEGYTKAIEFAGDDEHVRGTLEDGTQNVVVQTISIPSGGDIKAEAGIGAFEASASLSDLIDIEKVLINGDSTDEFPLGSRTFSFTVTCDSYSTLSGTDTPYYNKSNFVNTNGTASATVTKFGKDSVKADWTTGNNITVERVGYYTLTVKEDIGTLQGVKYDENVYSVKLKAYNKTIGSSPEPVIEVESVTKSDGTSSDNAVFSDNIAKIKFINNYPTGSVSVKKEVEGKSVPEDAEFGIVFSFELNGKELGGNYPYTVSGGTGAAGSSGTVASDGTVKIKAGQTVTVSNLPENTEVTVTETNDPAYKAEFSVGSATGESANVTIVKDDKKEVTVKNTHLEGSLSITKTVDTSDPNGTGEFTFTVNVKAPASASKLSLNAGFERLANIVSPPLAPLSLESFSFELPLKITGEDVSGAPTEVEFENGNAEITLKKGQTAVISGLPKGYEFTVSEKVPAGYESSVTVGKLTGEIIEDDTAAVTINNNFKTGSLTVQKELIGAADTSTEFEFEISLTPPEDVTLSKEYGSLSLGDASSDGTRKGTLTLKAGESVKIDGIPSGTSYTVTEKDNSEDNYALTSQSGESGLIAYENKTEPEDAKAAVFTNSKLPTATVTINKTLNGDYKNSSIESHEFSFTAELSEVDGAAATNDQKSKFALSGGTITIEKTSADGTGSVDFTAQLDGDFLNYTSHTYTYIIKENAGTQSYIDFDDSVYSVTVTATKDASGKLTAEVTKYSIVDGDSAPEVRFINEYIPKSKTLALSVKKYVTLNDPHTPLPDGHTYDFEFTLSPDGDNPGGAELSSKTTVTVDGINKESVPYGESYNKGSDTEQAGAEVSSGKDTTFGNITFTKAGTYKFTVTENINESKPAGSAASTGAFHSDGDKTIEVVVEDINGELVITGCSLITHSEGVSETKTPITDNTVTFVNEYRSEPVVFTINIAKTLKGNALPASPEYSFNFGVRLTKTLVGGVEHRHSVTITGNNASILGSSFASSTAQTKDIKITFKEPGDYYFDVVETIKADGTLLTAPPFDMNPTKHTITVHVVDDGGKLKVDSYTFDENTMQAASHTLNFENTYKPTAATKTITLTKNITGDYELVNSYDFGFTFTPDLKNSLVEGSAPTSLDAKTAGVTVSAGNRTSNTTVDFSFDKAGTYIYTVTEDALNSAYADFFTKDSSKKTLKIEVEDKGGHLEVTSCTVDGDDSHEVSFNNEYKPKPATLTLSVEKTVSGHKLEAGHPYVFAFAASGTIGSETLSSITAEVNAVTNAGANLTDNTASFSAFTLDKVGEYTFRVTETSSPDGFVKNTKTYTVTVNVEDKGGHLEVTSCTVDDDSEDPDEVTTGENATATVHVNNEYKPAAAKVTFNVVKNVELQGHTLPEGHKYTFRFELKKSGETDALETVEITVDKDTDLRNALNKAFKAIDFNEAGEYSYTVTELSVTDSEDSPTGASNCGFTVNPAAGIATISFTVEDKDGHLKVNGEENATLDAKFTNSYSPKEATLDIEVNKIINGDNVPESFEYSFGFRATEISDYIEMTGGTVAVAKADIGKGSKHLAALTFNKEDDYTVTVSETNNYSSFTPESSNYTLNVSVEDKGGVLEVTDVKIGDNSIYGDGKAIVNFTNTYEAGTASLGIKVEKTVNGDNVLPNGHDYSFTFTVEATGDTPAVSDKKIVIHANSETDLTKELAGTLSGALEFDKVGVYTYRVSESIADSAAADGGDNNYGFTVTPGSCDITVETDVDASGVIYIKSCEVTGGSFDNTTNTATLNFENTYKPTAAAKTITLTKNITGDYELVNSYDFGFTFTPDLKNSVVEGSTPTSLDTKTAGVTVSTGNRTSNTTVDFSFDKAGTYIYTVTEDALNSAYADFFTKDSSKKTLKIEVEDKGGHLEVTSCTVDGDDSHEVSFNNEYKPKPATLTLSVEKTVSGHKLEAGHPYVFAFAASGTIGSETLGSITAEVNAVTNAGANLTDNTASFSAFTLDKVGEYTFRVTETLSPDGFVENTKTYTVTVKVEDKGGHLEVTSCTVDDDSEDPDEVTTGENATAAVHVNNEYKPAAAKVTFNVVKNVELQGHTLPEGHEYTFKFELKKSKETEPIETVEIIVDKDTDLRNALNKAFKTIEFDEAGRYSYTVTELGVTDSEDSPTGASNCGFTVDPAAGIATISFTVVDEDGYLKVNGEENATLDAEFTNSYSPKEATLNIEVNKIINGDDVPESFEYSFGFIAAESSDYKMTGGTVAVAKADIGKSKHLAALTFNKEDDYTVTVSETNVYSSFTPVSDEYTLIVSVEDKGGVLEVTDVKIGDNSIYGGGKAIVNFTNTYEAGTASLGIKVEKTVKGDNVLPNGHDYSFTFTVEATGDTPEVLDKKIVIHANSETDLTKELAGTLSGALEFDEVGVYTYKVTESIADSAAADGGDNNYGFTVTPGNCNITVETDVDASGVIYIKSCKVTGGSFDNATDTVTLNFTNTYKPTSVNGFVLGVKKTVRGILPEHEYTFDFVLNGEGASYSTSVSGITTLNSADVHIAEFDGFEFTEEKDYVYTLSETVTDNMHYDGSDNSGFKALKPVRVVISVVDDGGKLRVDRVTVDGRPVDFTALSAYVDIENVYVPKEISVDTTDKVTGKNHVITVDKTLETVDGTGIDFPETFDFTAEVTSGEGAGWEKDGVLVKKTHLYTEGGIETVDAGGNVLTESGKGTLSITGLKFTAAGEYTVKVTENAPQSDRIDIDGRTLELYYKVVDKGGVLEIEKAEIVNTEGDGFVFKNTFNPKPVSDELEIVKQLRNVVTGYDMLNTNAAGYEPAYQSAFGFAFKIVEGGSEFDEEHILLNDKKVVEVTESSPLLNTYGKVDFGKLEFMREGEYTFEIYEVIPTPGNRLNKVTYDSRHLIISYYVTVDPKTGELAVSRSHHYSGSVGAGPHRVPTLVNYYGPMPCTLTIVNNLKTEPEGIDFDTDKTLRYHITLKGKYISLADAPRVEYEYFMENPAQQAMLILAANVENPKLGFIRTVDASGNVTYESEKDIYIPFGYSVTIEGIPAYNTEYTVTQFITGDDIADGYSFESESENYLNRYTDSEDNLISKSEDKTDDSQTPTEIGRFVSEYDGAIINFNNKYTLTYEEKEISGIVKTVSGRDFIDGDSFTFTATVAPTEGSPADGAGFVAADAAGNVTLTDRITASVSYSDNGGTVPAPEKLMAEFAEKLRFTKAGTYILTVTENAPEGRVENGLTYDSTVYTVTYTAEDTGFKGKLTVNSDAPKEFAFENTYLAAATPQVSFNIEKNIITAQDGIIPHAETYKFVYTDESGEETEVDIRLDEGILTGSENVNLGSFEAAGDYNCTVVEQAGSAFGTVYDSSKHTVTVRVTDNYSLGKLEYEVLIDGTKGDTVVFDNRYNTADLTVTKTVTGIDGLDTPDRKYRFTVVLTDSYGNPLEDGYTCEIYKNSDGIAPLSIGTGLMPKPINTVTVKNGDTVELAHGEKFVIKGLPDGTIYRVFEEAVGGFKTYVNGEPGDSNSGVFDYKNPAVINFVNRYDGTVIYEVKEFSFKTLNDAKSHISAREGDLLTYTVDWQNPKTKAATVTVTDKLSEGVDYISATGGDSVSYDENTRTVTWIIENAEAFEKGSLEITVKVNGSAENLGSIKNSAHVSAVIPGSPEDPNPDVPAEDDSDEVVVPTYKVSIVKEQSAPGYSKTTEPIVVRSGDEITYYLTVTVSGNKDALAENVTVRDIIPDGLVLTAVNSDVDYTVDPDSGIVTFNLGTMTSELPKTVSYSVKVPAGVSEDTPWQSHGYVYAGHDTAAEGVSEEYPWIPSNDVSSSPVGDLTVTKNVICDGEETAPNGIKFRFTLKFFDKNGNPLAGAYSYTREDAAGAFEGGSLSLSLEDGESVVIKALPAGTVYEISEEEIINFVQDENNILGGTVTNDGVKNVFVNHYSFEAELKGDITVTKTVSGNDEDMLKPFGFTMQLSDETLSGQYGDLYFENGVARFELKHSQSVIASGLPADIAYTVTEDAVSAEGFKITVSENASGYVPANGSETVMFLNEREENAVGSLSVGNTVIGGNASFSFTVTLSDPNINGSYGEMNFSGGVASFTLSGGERITALSLPAGIGYTVIENDANSYGYSTTYSDDGNGMVPANNTANVNFVNTLRVGSLAVKNTVVGSSEAFDFTVTLSDNSISGVYGGMNFENGVARFSLANAESVEAVGLPAGIGYTVVEEGANLNGFTTTSVGEVGTVPENMTATAAFVNTRPVSGRLTVSKTAIDAPAGARFDFGITLAASDGTPITDGIAGLTFGTDGVGSFSLADGESISIVLPEGTSYNVFEITDQDYTVQVLGAQSGSVTVDGAAVSFVNTRRTGGLIVTNTVSGNASDPLRAFNFTVHITSSEPVNGRYGDMTFINGEAVFTLTGGQSASASGLPAGAGYSVSQTDANVDGYITTSIGEIGTVPENSAAKAEFTNTKQIEDADEFGSLTVVNHIIGTVTDEEFTFRVRVKAPLGQGISLMSLSEYDSVTVDENGDTVFVFTLKHGESRKLPGLPAGSLYAVEQDENIYYQTTSVNRAGAIIGGTNVTAVFTNRWNVGDLVVRAFTEDDSGNIIDYDGAEFTYEVTLQGLNGRSLNYPSHITENYETARASNPVIMEFDENGVARFTLRNGWSAYAPDLPVGLEYSVKLIDQSNGYYTEKSATGAVGEIEYLKTEEAEFVYEIRTGSITLNKILLDSFERKISSEKMFDFTFTLTGVDGKPVNAAFRYDGSYRGTVSSDGGVIRIHADDEITIYGIPEGMEYLITEAETYGYVCTSCFNESGTMTAGGHVTTVYINTVVMPPQEPEPTTSEEPDEPDKPDDPDKVVIERPTEGRTEQLEESVCAETKAKKRVSKKIAFCKKFDI